ncbi:MAG TPA: glycerol-3-phosphate 1-O-acyltransferase PlsY [Arenimonas sp.]|nr:glycerol-3-phosphate 1-O-acyltransferase PlsY [Arenimonas sp.]
MLDLLWLPVVAYLLGSVSGSLWLGRLRGVDIRRLGSGNAGGTNALRTQGWRFALGVVLIDIGKGLLVVWLALRFAPESLRHALVWTSLLAAMAGHIWPLFHGFRGGKGAATLVGGLLLAWPLALLAVLVTWLLVLSASGYVGVATVLAGFALLPMAAWGEVSIERWAFAFSAALLLLYTHRGNLQRLRAGSEHRFERARLWHRLWQRWRA